MRYLIVLLTLTGCVSAEQRAANIVAHFGPTCEAMGFAQGSDGWRQCILQQQARAGAAFNQGAQTFMLMQPAMQPVPGPAMQAPVRTHCMPNPAGGVTCITR